MCLRKFVYRCGCVIIVSYICCFSIVILYFVQLIRSSEWVYVFVSMSLFDFLKQCMVAKRCIECVQKPLSIAVSSRWCGPTCLAMVSSHRPDLVFQTIKKFWWREWSYDFFCWSYKFFFEATSVARKRAEDVESWLEVWKNHLSENIATVLWSADFFLDLVV